MGRRRPPDEGPGEADAGVVLVATIDGPPGSPHQTDFRAQGLQSGFGDLYRRPLTSISSFAGGRSRPWGLISEVSRYRSQAPAAGVSLGSFARAQADYARTF